MTGQIFNIQKFCLHDGPGIRSTVFFKGCNLRCAWCSNPESQATEVQLTLDARKCVRCGKCVSSCPNGARALEGGVLIVDKSKCSGCGACVQECPTQAIAREGRAVSVQEVVDEVMKDEAFYAQSGGGVTFSGGEVLLQQDFACELARRLRARGISVAIETAAAVPNEHFRAFLREIDYVMIDLKHYDSECHRMATGIGNEQVVENIRSVRESGLPYVVRIPVIPGFNDELKDAEGFAGLFGEIGVDHVQLLPFHQMGERKYELLGREYGYSGIAQLHREDLGEYQQVFEKHGIRAEV